jgi:hypothetical protein
MTNILNQIVVRNNEFMRRFEKLGNKEFNKIH